MVDFSELADGVAMSRRSHRLDQILILLSTSTTKALRNVRASNRYVEQFFYEEILAHKLSSPRPVTSHFLKRARNA